MERGSSQNRKKVRKGSGEDKNGEEVDCKTIVRDGMWLEVHKFAKLQCEPYHLAWLRNPSDSTTWTTRKVVKRNGSGNLNAFESPWRSLVNMKLILEKGVDHVQLFVWTLPDDDDLFIRPVIRQKRKANLHPAKNFILNAIFGCFTTKMSDWILAWAD